VQRLHHALVHHGRRAARSGEVSEVLLHGDPPLVDLQVRIRIRIRIRIRARIGFRIS